MKNLYYKIWVDVITNIKKNPQRKNDWKFYSMFLMTILISLNLLTVLMWVGFLGLRTNFLKINIFPGTMIDSFVMYVIQFATPCFILNYFTILYKGKYETLMKKYPENKGRLFLIYMFLTIGIFIVPVLFYWKLH